MFKDELSKFDGYLEAARAIVSAFIGENVGSHEGEIRVRKELTPLVYNALERDGQLPNDYEVEALNGGVPEDGSDPDENGNDVKDYGIPEEVRKKFPHTDRVINSQF